MTLSQASSPSKPVFGDWNLQDLLWVALSYRRLIVLVTLLFLLFGVRYCLKTQPIYESATTVRMPGSGGSSGAAQMSYLQGADQSETAVEICKSANVASRAITELNLNKSPGVGQVTQSSMIGNLLGAIQVTTILNSNILSIRASAPSPLFAAKLANAWAKCFIQADLDLSREAASARREFLEQQVATMRAKLDNPDLKLNDESKSDQAIYDQLLENLRQARIAESNESLGMVVVDQALPPDGPVRPQKRKALEIALFLGLLVGYQLALLLDRIFDRVRTLDRLKRITGLANYAMVPDFRTEFAGSSSGNVTGLRSLIHDPVFEYSSYRESFRVLRTNLTYAPLDKPLVTVSVLSPGHEEGKTLVNANLALSLAQVGKKVLLVDADLRKPALGHLFGVQVPENKGLPSTLSGHGTWKSMIVSSGIGNLDLLPSRVLLPNTTELLSGEPMKRFVTEVKNAYDYVVFDGAPLLQMTDSLVLASLLDGVVLLARWNRTRSAEVGKAMEELRAVNARVLGTLLNYADLKKGYFSAGSLSEYGHKTFAEKKGAGWERIFSVIKKGLGIFKWFLP